MQFKIWLTESDSFGKYKYLGQCDRLRKTQDGEYNWQRMMHFAQPVTRQEFLSHTDLSPLLDDDEDIDTFFSNHPDAQFFASNWGGQPCYFFQTGGFEFIFGG